MATTITKQTASIIKGNITNRTDNNVYCDCNGVIKKTSCDKDGNFSFSVTIQGETIAEIYQKNSDGNKCNIQSIIYSDVQNDGTDLNNDGKTDSDKFTHNEMDDDEFDDTDKSKLSNEQKEDLGVTEKAEYVKPSSDYFYDGDGDGENDIKDTKELYNVNNVFDVDGDGVHDNVWMQIDDKNDYGKITIGDTYKIIVGDSYTIIKGNATKNVEGSRTDNVTGNSTKKVLKVDKIKKTVTAKDGVSKATITNNTTANSTSTHTGDVTKTHYGKSTSTHHGIKHQSFMGGVYRKFLGARQSFSLAAVNDYFGGAKGKIVAGLDMVANLTSKIKFVLFDDALYIHRNNYIVVKAETVGSEREFKLGVIWVHGDEKSAKASKASVEALSNDLSGHFAKITAITDSVEALENSTSAIDNQLSSIKQQTNAIDQNVAALNFTVAQQINV